MTRLIETLVLSIIIYSMYMFVNILIDTWFKIIQTDKKGE